MNWLLIVILALIIGNVIWGYKKGFMQVALSLVSWIIVLIACQVATPIVADAIMEHTPLADTVQEFVTEKINTIADDAMNGVTDGVLNNETIAEIEAALPEQIKEAILGENESFADLINSADNMKEIEIDTTGVAKGAANLIALIIVLILTRIALIVVEKVLDLVAKLPLIGQANTLLGIVAGAIKGLVWCWVVLTVIAMLAYTGANTELIALVNESPILIWLYEKNPIMGVLSGVL